MERRPWCDLQDRISREREKPHEVGRVSYCVKALPILNRFKCISNRTVLVRRSQACMRKTYPLLNPSRTLRMTASSLSVSASLATTIL